MYTFGCIVIALGTLCYSGSSTEGTKITCSDQPMQGTYTCQEWNALMSAQIELGKRSGCTSPDGSSSSCAFTLSAPPR